MEALVTEADRRGMQTAVEPTRHQADSVGRLLDARGRVFDAVVLIGHDVPESVPDALGARPVVLVQCAPSRGEADRVDEDVSETAMLVARHLAVMGRTRPALLGVDRGEPVLGAMV